MKAVTMSDVAKKASVSKSTVSQYINKRYEFMGADTKERIREAIEVLNYKPNVVAKSLKQKKTSTVGVIVANILHSFSTQVIRAIEDVCNRSDLSVIVCNADDDPQKERNYIEMLRAKQVDGLIIFPTAGNAELYKEMVHENYPLVFVDRIIQDSGVSTILLDNEKASEMLVEHLYEKNYKRLAFITSSLEIQITPRIERLNGFIKALEKYSLPLIDGFYAGIRMGDVQEVLEVMFSQPERPDALICGNDLTLLETLKFINKKGWSIPTDIALASIDEVPYSEIFQPPLTIVAQPAYAIGTNAANLLLEKIDSVGESLKEIMLYSPELIVRKST